MLYLLHVERAACTFNREHRRTSHHSLNNVALAVDEWRRVELGVLGTGKTEHQRGCSKTLCSQARQLIRHATTQNTSSNEWPSAPLSAETPHTEQGTASASAAAS
jgi:hypothetical protein